MIPSTMILIGSLLILGLAGYWMRRAVKAEQCLKDMRGNAEYLFWLAAEYEARINRITKLETPNMAHVGKKAVAIAKGEL